ncbi:MAG: acylphosphatase, partial [Phycisphaerae bacterium]
RAGRAMTGRIRRSVWFAGRVQGVGFRFTACELAERFAVTGYVRNLRDGRVELVAEGDADEVDRFVRAVHEAMHGYIRSVEQTDSPATGEFADFGVRY